MFPRCSWKTRPFRDRYLPRRRKTANASAAPPVIAPAPPRAAGRSILPFGRLAGGCLLKGVGAREDVGIADATGRDQAAACSSSIARGRSSGMPPPGGFDPPALPCRLPPALSIFGRFPPPREHGTVWEADRGPPRICGCRRAHERGPYLHPIFPTPNNYKDISSHNELLLGRDVIHPPWPLGWKVFPVDDSLHRRRLHNGEDRGQDLERRKRGFLRHWRDLRKFLQSPRA